MKTTIIVLTLLALVISATVASAQRGMAAQVQQAWKRQQAEQMKADQQFGSAFRDVAKSMAAVPAPDLGTDWGTAATAGGGTYYCPPLQRQLQTPLEIDSPVPYLYRGNPWEDPNEIHN